jgi:hypothetical protein
MFPTLLPVRIHYNIVQEAETYYPLPQLAKILHRIFTLSDYSYFILIARFLTFRLSIHSAGQDWNLFMEGVDRLLNTVDRDNLNF